MKNNRCIFNKEGLIDFDKLIRGKNINFLIGSGASARVYPTLSLSPELKSMILDGETIINSDNINSFEDLITSPIKTEKKEFLYFYFFHNWINKMFNTVTVINQDNQENKGKYKGTLEVYTKFIQKMFIFLQNEGNDRPKRMNIFTTNYDLFFELAYDKISHSVPLGFLNDGSKGMFNKIMDIKNFYLNISHSGFNDEYRYEIPTLNLIKMHGSISWIEDEINSKDNKKHKVIKVENSFVSTKTPQAKLIEDYNKIFDEKYPNKQCSNQECPNKDSNKEYQEIDNKFFNEIINNKSKLDLIKEFKKKLSQLCIINPDKNKFATTVFQQHYYQMLRSFSYELEKKHTILIVFGFSFKDEHITNILERSLSNPELTVYVIPYDKTTYEEINQKFSNYDNFKFLLCHQSNSCYENDKFHYNKQEKIKGDFKFLTDNLFEFIKLEE